VEKSSYATTWQIKWSNPNQSRSTREISRVMTEGNVL
jgi:hypothetical protein